MRRQMLLPDILNSNGKEANETDPVMQPMRYRDIESAFFVVSDSFEKNSLALAFAV